MARVPSFFKLEQTELPVAPLVPRQPLLLLLLKFLPALRPDGLLQLVVRQGEVDAVRVHLEELKVAPVEEVVEEIVVELQHAELGQLVHDDSCLKRAVDLDLWLAALDLVDVPNYVQVFEPSRAELLVKLVLVLGVHRPRLALHCFDELAVSAVAQELEHFREQRLFLVRVTRPPVVVDLLHKPVEDLLGHVVDCAVDSRDIEAAVEVPLQEGGVDKHLFSPTARPGASFGLGNGFGRCLGLLPQLPGDFDVHLRKAKPLTCHQLERELVRRLPRGLVVHDPPWATGHVMEHRAWVEGIGVEAQGYAS